MAASKYKKVLPVSSGSTAATGYPPQVRINSDWNLIQFVSANGDSIVYRYIESETKKNMLVTFTKEGFEQFQNQNKIIQPCKK